MATMTTKILQQLCKDNGGYVTASLNDKLYANYKGFTTISRKALAPYTGLKALFLEGNGLDNLHELPELAELRCLFLQQNALSSLQGLHSVRQLQILNIQGNCITSLDGIECCPELTTLNASGNRLRGVQCLAALARCPALSTLDLQNNQLRKQPAVQLEDGAAVMQLLEQLPTLHSLYLKGNPLVTSTRNYRKQLVVRLTVLRYLDDRPVSDSDRVCAEAWAQGGVEGERAARAQLLADEERQRRENLQFMINLREQGFKKRRAMLGLPESDTEGAAGLGCSSSDSDDGDEPDIGGHGVSVVDGCRVSTDSNIENLPPPAEADAPKAAQRALQQHSGQQAGALPVELQAGFNKLASYVARPEEEEPPELTAARASLVATGQSLQSATWQPLTPAVQLPPASQQQQQELLKAAECQPQGDKDADKDVMDEWKATERLLATSTRQLGGWDAATHAAVQEWKATQHNSAADQAAMSTVGTNMQQGSHAGQSCSIQDHCVSELQHVNFPAAAPLGAGALKTAVEGWTDSGQRLEGRTDSCQRSLIQGVNDSHAQERLYNCSPREDPNTDTKPANDLTKHGSLVCKGAGDPAVDETLQLLPMPQPYAVPGGVNDVEGTNTIIQCKAVGEVAAYVALSERCSNTAAAELQKAGKGCSASAKSDVACTPEQGGTWQDPAVDPHAVTCTSGSAACVPEAKVTLAGNGTIAAPRGKCAAVKLREVVMDNSAASATSSQVAVPPGTGRAGGDGAGVADAVPAAAPAMAAVGAYIMPEEEGMQMLQSLNKLLGLDESAGEGPMGLPLNLPPGGRLPLTAVSGGVPEVDVEEVD